MQLAKSLNCGVLSGSEPGVVLGHRVAVVTHFEGEQGEDLVNEGCRDRLMEEAEPGLHDWRWDVGAEEV